MLIDPASILLSLPVAVVAGTGSVSLPVPANPNLAGFAVHVQAVMADAAQPAGWAFSNGLSLVICP